jgi:hypothetical protein
MCRAAVPDQRLLTTISASAVRSVRLAAICAANTNMTIATGIETSLIS